MSVCLVSTLAGHAGHMPALMPVSQHIVCTGELIPVSTWTHTQADESITVKNAIVCSAGKSIIQMLRGHQLVQYTQSASPVGLSAATLP